VKIAVASIVYRWCDPQHAANLFELVLQPNVGLIHRGGDELIDRARSIAATRFLLETDADVLFSVDADVVFQPSDAIALCRQALDYSIVGGLYTTRYEQLCIPAVRPFPNRPFIAGADPTPIQVPSAATGFLAVHRRVLEAMVAQDDLPLTTSDDHPPFYPFYLPVVSETQGWLGEDFSFCLRAQRAGFETYLNPSVVVKHVGSKTFHLEDGLPRPPRTEVPAIRVTMGDDGGFQLVPVPLEAVRQPA
jgi:hypothetical protein